MKQNLSQVQGQRQLQRMMASSEMQQAIHLMQKPVLELSQEIQLALEANPLLEAEGGELYDDLEALKELSKDLPEREDVPRVRTKEEDALQAFLESSIRQLPTLFEHLMQQAHDIFSTERELEIAECLIGSLDERGFLEEVSPLHGFSKEEWKPVLEKIQTFEPFGVGATDVRETFLIQLRCLGKEETLAFQIVEGCFENLLHNRMPAIAKDCGVAVEEVEVAMQDTIAKLDFHPGGQVSRDPVPIVVPDVTIREEGEGFAVAVDEEFIPTLRVNGRYLRMLDDPATSEETKQFIKNKLSSAKWLMRNIYQRNSTLERIAGFLAVKQRAFFAEDGGLVPLTMKEVAQALELHESTIARAVANKYVESPRGLLPLRQFFTNAYETGDGVEISSRTVREGLQRIIEGEDKKKPLSDEKISKMLSQQGITCARRTIAKYRGELGLGTSQQRRRY